MRRSFSTPAIVLKRSSVGETDRVVTLLTRKQGKLVCVAKGVRKMSSSKRAFLEPGNYIDAFFIETKSLPLLTQARLIKQFSNTAQDLKQIRQLTQVLEIVDRLFVENEEDQALFDQVQEIITLLNPSPLGGEGLESESPPRRGEDARGEVKSKLEQIISQLGYHSAQKSSLLDHVAQLSDRPMRSWEYLRI